MIKQNVLELGKNKQLPEAHMLGQDYKDSFFFFFKIINQIAICVLTLDKIKSLHR